MKRVIALILLGLLAVPYAVAQSNFPLLLADRPDPVLAEKLSTFGQFVGEWTFEGTEFHEDGTRATDKGELHFHWILQGQAIQDVWMETERSDDKPKVLGTTLRFYNPKTDTWTVTWVHPGYVTVRSLTGRKVGEDIVIEGTRSSGTKLHWIFDQIRKDSFRWHAEELKGGAWRTTDELQARRKLTSSSNAAFGRLQTLIGDWQGAHDGKETRLKYTLTADGSALMEEFRPGDQAPMVTMFSVDGDRLVATHYCSAGNQPQMATQPIHDPDTGALAFSLVRITGMKTPDDWHNTGLELRLPDAQHLTQHWTWQSNGKTGTTDFEFTRKKD
jgi:hypothetical protein